MADKQPNQPAPTPLESLKLAIDEMATHIRSKRTWQSRRNLLPGQDPVQMCNLEFNPEAETNFEGINCQQLADKIIAKGRELLHAPIFKVQDANGSTLECNAISVQPGYLVTRMNVSTAVGRVSASIREYSLSNAGVTAGAITAQASQASKVQLAF